MGTAVSASLAAARDALETVTWREAQESRRRY